HTTEPTELISDRYTAVADLRLREGAEDVFLGTLDCLGETANNFLGEALGCCLIRILRDHVQTKPKLLIRDSAGDPLVGEADVPSDLFISTKIRCTDEVMQNPM